MNKTMRAIVGALLAGSTTFAATGVASASTIDYPNKTTHGFELASASSAGEREIVVSITAEARAILGGVAVDILGIAGIEEYCFKS